jgi:putative peptidoglycan lipid II flippase
MQDNQCKYLNEKSLLKPTLQITFLSFVGILVSFCTQMFVAKQFGAGMEIDAYYVASVIPDYIITVLVGAMAFTFIPTFIEYETTKGKQDAWKIASIFTNLTFIVLFVISVLGFIYAKQLTLIIAPGFIGEEFSLAIKLLRIILPSIIFSGLNSLLSSLYYAEHRFLSPAVATLVSTTLMLLSVVFISPYCGVKSLAWGRLIGTAISLLVVIPILFKKKRYHFNFNFNNEGVIHVLKTITPLLFAGIIYRVTMVIEKTIASTLPVGSITYLSYANRIITLLETMAVAGISTSIFPVMARGWAENDLAKVRYYFVKGIRIIMLITFPIAAIVVMLRVPITQILFERGAFDHKITLAISNVLLFLMPYFILSCICNILWKGFYISQKTKLSAGLNIILALVYILLAYILANIFSYLGLAIALCLQYLLATLIGFIGMRILYNGINSKELLVCCLKVLCASAFSMISIFISFRLYSDKINLFLSLFMAGFIGIIIYISMIIYIFKLEEAVSLQVKVKHVLTDGFVWILHFSKNNV